MSRVFELRTSNFFRLSTFGFRFCPLLVCLFALASSLAPARAAALRALILSGSNNHKWQETTPEIRTALEETGRFRCDVVEDVAAMKLDAFAPYDVIVSNFNTFGKKDAGEVWNAAVRTAFLDHIRKGRGFVVVHAGSCFFNDWAEFQQVAGATWGKGTSHGARHAAQVSFCDTDHPVTRGLKPFWTFDEFWQSAGTAPGAKPLAQVTPSTEHRGSGKPEKIVFVTELGAGRGFCLLLGHDVVAMKNAGFRTLLQRGTEWAASGKVTIAPVKNWPDTEASASPDAKPAAAVTTPQKSVEEILAGVTVWRFGQPREALLACANLVAERSKAPASKEARELAARLAKRVADPQATTDGKKFACEQLGLIGNAAQVPLLAELLDDKELALAARQALEWIPGEGSLAAIRAALEKAAGAQRIGLINTLAARRDAKAVPLIAKSLGDADAATAGAAMDALGRIGGAQTAKALLAAQPPAALRQRWAAALLQCAATSPTERDAIFAELIAADQPSSIRLAAFPACVSALGGKGNDAVLAALSGDDKTMQAAAIRALRATRDGALVQAAADRLEKLPPESQVPVITLLGDRGDAAALPALTKAAANTDAAVKLAALAALGLAGNASTVPVLAGAVEGADDEAVKVIAESLVRLRGGGVDEAMVAALRTSAPTAQRELIRALVAREAKSALPALLEAAKSTNAKVSNEAVAGLGKLGDKATCGSLLELLETNPDAASSALAAICRREGSVEPVLSALAKAPSAKKAALLGVLGAAGSPQALEAVRGAVKSDDANVRTAAVRALAGWPDASPLEDLVSLAVTTSDAKCKALALRGVARLAAEAKDVPPPKRVEFISRAMKMGGVNEQKALLGALGNIAHPAALKLAESCANNPELAAEAKAAIAQIKSGTKPRAAGRAAGPAFTNDVVKLFTSPDNLARGATAMNPDGLRPDGQGQGPHAAIDGNPSSYWDETDLQKLYQIRVQLKQRATVACIRILGYGHHNYAPKDFEVICDGKVVKKIEDAQYKDNVLTLALPPTECEAVELKITGYYSRSPAIRELGIYGKPSESVK
ncbi:MAG: ThuA domain-containing protein [Verrucomicrobia bacterium]|nr:ThuA domain-containing protein [Verrucomicrobiota bacterium]